MKTFKDLKFKQHPSADGIISRITFENGYGASVVRHEYSYGGKDGLYELAVLDTEGEIHYDNSVAEGDVHGYLNEEGVTVLLKRIQLL